MSCARQRFSKENANKVSNLLSWKVSSQSDTSTPLEWFWWWCSVGGKGFLQRFSAHANPPQHIHIKGATKVFVFLAHGTEQRSHWSWHSWKCGRKGCVLLCLVVDPVLKCGVLSSHPNPRWEFWIQSSEQHLEEQLGMSPWRQSLSLSLPHRQSKCLNTPPKI